MLIDKKRMAKKVKIAKENMQRKMLPELVIMIKSDIEYFDYLYSIFPFLKRIAYGIEKEINKDKSRV